LIGQWLWLDALQKRSVSLNWTAHHLAPRSSAAGRAFRLLELQQAYTDPIASSLLTTLASEAL